MPPLLEIEDLSVGFTNEEGALIPITDRVSFVLDKGEVQGLVGESGCGKSVTALALLRLLPQPSGRILSGHVRFEGRDLLTLAPEEIRRVRGSKIAMIFQEPSSALNPLMRIRDQLLELFSYHEEALHSRLGSQATPLKRTTELLERVGFSDPNRILEAWPHELSGGMLQRVMIALALLLKPSILIADEPTTALDVTVQAQIMELLLELQREEGSAVLLITHNLGLVAQYASSLAVMYAGRVVEDAPVAEFLKQPLHPYSVGLMNALPDRALMQASEKDAFSKRRLNPIEGQVPRPSEFPTGCRFAPRCPKVREICQKKPELLPYPQSEAPRRGLPARQKERPHLVACFEYEA